MKSFPLSIFCLNLVFVLSRSWGLDLLSVSTDSFVNFQPKNRFESLVHFLADYDRAWEEKRPHKAEAILEETLPLCENWLQEPLKNTNNIEKVREGYLCLILESERINRLSPWGVTKSSERLRLFFDKLQSKEIPLKEKLYANGRIYSSLPALYGRDFKKALVALETLKRLEKNPKVSVPWILRIRKMQGKKTDENEDFLESGREKRKETDGLPTSLMPILYGGFPQGIGIQLRGQDHALFDTDRRIQGRLFVTYRGSIGGEVKFEDYQTLSPVKSLIQFSYLHGIQEHHGVGLFSPKNSLELYIDRGTTDFAFQKALMSDFYIKAGWRFHSSHLREVRGGILESGLEGISNTFDMGLLAEVGFDSRDSEIEPYRGQRVYFQSYLPRKSIGSSRSFERFLGLAENYWLINLQTQLKLQGVFCTISESAPFSWFSQLSGTIPFSGLRPTRFTDRSMMTMASELRWKQLAPVTLFGYGNAATMASSTKKLFHESIRWGSGLGAEIHLTRFRARAFRVEAGNFGGEWNFNSMIGVALD